MNRICKQLRVKSFGTVTIKKIRRMSTYVRAYINININAHARTRVRVWSAARRGAARRGAARRVCSNLSLNGCSRFTVARTRGLHREYFIATSAVRPISPFSLSTGVAFAPSSVYVRRARARVVLMNPSRCARNAAISARDPALETALPLGGHHRSPSPLHRTKEHRSACGGDLHLAGIPASVAVAIAVEKIFSQADARL